MTSIVIADDHPLIVESLAVLLEASGYEVLARCLAGDVALETIRRENPDLAIVDFDMPGMHGLDVLAQVRTEELPTRMVLLTASYDPAQLWRAYNLKVDGLVMKDAGASTIRLCVERVLAGEQWLDRNAMKEIMAYMATRGEALPELTPREADVVAMVGIGRRNKEIAYALGISEGTVKMYLHNLYRKLDVSSRTELALLAREHGMERDRAAQ